MAGTNVERTRQAARLTEEDRELQLLVNVYTTLSKDMNDSEAAAYRQSIYAKMGLNIRPEEESS